MSKRRLIYGSVRRFEAGSVISQKPRICGLGLDFCFYPPQTNQRGRSTAARASVCLWGCVSVCVCACTRARARVRRWDLFCVFFSFFFPFFFFCYSSLFKLVRTRRSMIFHGLPRILRIIKQWIFAFNRVHKSNALADTARCCSDSNHHSARR